jgi:hypothetical protein
VTAQGFRPALSTPSDSGRPSVSTGVACMSPLEVVLVIAGVKEFEQFVARGILVIGS